MVRTLTLDVSEEIYDSLAKMAKDSDRTVETLVEFWLSVVTHHDNSMPLPEFVGALSSNVPDWVDNHDYYIGQALMEEMLPSHGDGSEVA